MAIITNSASLMTNSSVYLKFGTGKMGPQTWGDYAMFGPNRIIEGVVDLTQVTAGNTLIVSDVMFYPVLGTSQLFIEQVEAVVETAAAGGTSFSFGLVNSDRTTVPTNYDTAFINAQVLAGINAAGKKIIYTNGVTSAGGLIGTAPAVQTPLNKDLVNSFYLTVTAAGTFSAGKIRLRVHYHALDNSITQ